MFTVKIQKNENMSILRELNSSCCVTLKRDKKNVHIGDYPKLPPGKIVSSVFEDVSDGCLHVIAKPSPIQAPTHGELISPIYRSFF
jgi:hypothetical protein